MPKAPKQKASFLSAPEGGEDIFHWHSFTTVFVYIVVFIVVIHEEIEQYSNDDEN